MSTRAQVDWEEENGALEREPEARTTRSRRALLGEAAGGFALAASGLFLPTRLEEAEARDGAYDGVLGGRHGKNRRGRDQRKRRTHGEKKDKNNGKRDNLKGWRNTALTVENTGGDPQFEKISVTFFFRAKLDEDFYGPPVRATDAIEMEIGQQYRFANDRFRVCALIQHHALTKGDLYVDVRNIAFWFPRGSVTQGKNLDPPNFQVGDYVLTERNFGVNEKAEFRTEACDGVCWQVPFDLTRTADTGYIEYIFHIR
jgi:hypothetical protein